MRTPFAIGIAASLAALSALALVADADERASTSPQAAIDAAAARVVAGFEGGDVVITHPFWEHGAWLGLQAAGGDADRHPWPALWIQERPDPIELLSFDRMWVIGAHGRPAEPPPLLADAATAVLREEIDAHTTVALYALDRLERLRTLTADFDDLVTRRVHPDGKIDRCRPRGNRHRCRRQPWLDLQIAERDVYHQDVRWIFFHPGPDDEVLEVDWNELPRDTWLMVRAGFSQKAVRMPDGAPVTLTVRLDGTEVDRFVLSPHRYWLERRLIRLPAGAAPATLTLTAQTAENGWRELLIQADVLSDAPAPVRAWATAIVQAPAASRPLAPPPAE